MTKHNPFQLHRFGYARLATLFLAVACVSVIIFIQLRSPKKTPEKSTPDSTSQEASNLPEPKITASNGSAVNTKAKPNSVLCADQHCDHDKGLPDLDKRVAVAGGGDTKRQRALAVLRTKIPSVEVQFDPITGAPNYIMATGRFLDEVKSPPGDVYASVRGFVNTNAELFGHDAAAINDSQVTREDVTSHNGMRTVVWQQQVDGIPVYKTVLKANLTSDGALVTLGSHFMSDAPAATGMDANQRAALVEQPPVDVRKAVSLAAANLGDLVAPEQAQATSEPEGAKRRQRFSAPQISDTLAQLAWLPLNQNSSKLAWDVTLMSTKQRAMFRVLVDAVTGEVLIRTSLTNDVSNASFSVYADATTKKPFDSPNPMLPGTATPSGAQAAEVPRQLVTLQSVNPTASPNGWINDGVFETLGNNVEAHADTNGDNAPDLPRPTSGTRVFDFPIDLSKAPSTYKDAAVVHLFYMNNWMHDQLYSLGFTESAGNFQINNFGRGGFGNDPVQADAQDGSDTNNARMSTPADGSSPRMEMYIFTGPTPNRDCVFDNVVLLHEYTHGLSNRLVGGGVGISALATGGLGEGWSDFYALALLADPASDPNAVYPLGSYATRDLNGMTTNYYFGIRRYPYSTDMAKNPLTFRDIDPTQASPHTGIPLAPWIGASNDNPSQVHRVGEVWCMALWECRANLIAKYGGTAGNRKILQLVTDGMKLSPANPNLLQARDAIIQADLVTTGGADFPQLWAGFAKRGMGAGARSPASTTTTGVVQAFDLPDAMSVTPTLAVAATGPVGGPFTPSGQSYTVTNTDAKNPLSWTAATDAPWMSVSPAGGTLAAGASTAVTMAFNSASSALTLGSYSGTVKFTNTTSSAALPRTVNLTVVADYFTELFFTDNDTDNQSWLFTPNGSPNFYGVQRTASVSTFPTNPTGGTPLVLSDDSFMQVTPTGDATVKLYGTSYGTFYVGSNGYVTFGAGETNMVPELANHFNRPRIAALFDDLEPTLGTGSVSWKQLADRIAVTYQNVQPYGGGGPNDFQIEMFYDGRIRITCLGISNTSGLIGLSKGLGVPPNFINSNFSNYAVPQPLRLTVPAVATEGNGVLVGQGAVTLPAVQTTDVVVTLTSLNTREVTVPATVNILAGQLSATFSVTIVDDTVMDGTQTATITATAAGLDSASETISVLDNDLHHFSFDTVASPQTRGAAFPVTITAKDVNNVTITSYTASAGLSASGAGGADAITPGTTGAFIAGVWTGSVSVNTFDTNVVLAVSDGAGHVGASNAFNVGTGALHHFAWNTQAPSRTANAPVSATLTAQDAGNNTVTSFTGTAALNCGRPTKVVGTGTAETTTLPLYTAAHDERSQVIYLQSEIGAAGTIKGLTLNVTTLPGQTMNNWTIRMKHTSLASYATAAWETSAWTTVYQANQTIRSTGLTTFTFTTPFAYDGVSNLMVDFSFNNSSATKEGGVTCTTASATRTIQYFTDSGFGDPLTWSGTTNPPPSTSTILPNLQLQMDRTLPISPSVTGSFSSGTWTGAITLTQPATAVTLRAVDDAGHVGESTGFDVLASTDASLSSLVPSTGTLAPAFTSANTSYTSSVSNDSAVMTLTPVSVNAFATIQVRVNGGAYSNVVSALPSGSLTLAGGENMIEVRVTAQDTVTTKTYSISTTRRTPYQDWALGLGLSGAGADPDGDLDADGLKNIQEWAFGTTPTAGSHGQIQVNSGVLIAHGTPAVFTTPNGQGGVNLFALFGRRKDARTVGLTYSVEFSETLTAWTVSSVTPTVIAQDSEIEAVVIPLPQLKSYPPRIFFRVRVTGQ